MGDQRWVRKAGPRHDLARTVSDCTLTADARQWRDASAMPLKLETNHEPSMLSQCVFVSFSSRYMSHCRASGFLDSDGRPCCCYISLARFASAHHSCPHRSTFSLSSCHRKFHRLQGMATYQYVVRSCMGSRNCLIRAKTSC